ncbi:6420_t:CDS:2 [Rhizophagus irregularis]|nr:6420_t:CDS:2 [Rhizophagus irregularis]
MAQNLPSLCLFRILEFHSNNLLMLYRCALVNRDWCQLTIPFLWKRPFSLLHLYTPSKRLIEVYISGFSSKERKLIKNLREREEEEIPTKSLFNYVSFLRELDVAQAINLLECIGDFNPKLLLICSMISKQIEKILISIYIDKNIIQYPNEMGKLQNLCTLIQVQKNLNTLIIKNVRNGGLGEHGLFNLKIFKSKIQIPLLTFMILQANNRLTVLDVRAEDINYHELINLLEIISQNCKNLLEFSTYIIPDYNLLPLLLPILSSNTKLEKLVIDAETENNNIISEDVNNFLPILGKHLPSSLRVLNVLTRWLFHYDSLDKFFQESRAKLEVLKLKLTNLIKDDHIEVILKHSKNHLKLLDIEGTASISYDTWDKLQQEEHLHVEFHPDIEPTMLSRNYRLL